MPRRTTPGNPATSSRQKPDTPPRGRSGVTPPATIVNEDPTNGLGKAWAGASQGTSTVTVPVESSRTTIHAEGDSVNHPDHYNSHPSGVECSEIVRWMPFNTGNVVKYLWREGLKDTEAPLQDLYKAQWYLNDEIKKREGQTLSLDELRAARGRLDDAIKELEAPQ